MEIFLIKLAGKQYKVIWPGRGKIVRSSSILLMVNLAFETSANEVTFINSEFVWTCSSKVAWQYKGDEFGLAVARQIGELDCIVFAKEKHALDFVDRVEKTIVWNLLKKPCLTTIGDFFE